MPQPFDCLCQSNSTSCAPCAAIARGHWLALAAQNPQATPGQLIEQAIQQDRAEAVLGVLQNSDIDVNQSCDPDRYGSVSPIMVALRAGNARIVALVAGQPGFDLAKSLPEYERWTWVRFCSLPLLQVYLGIRGSDVNQPDGNGTTLLHEVVYDARSDDKLRELLARPGIVIDSRQADGTTPLYQAVLAANTGAFRILRDHGADVNNRNTDNRWAILMCAVAANSPTFVELLLCRSEIEINATDDVQDSALHIAAERGHTRMVELMLEHPAIQINGKNHLGWTPLSKAAFGGHVAVVRVLLGRPDLEVNFVDQDRQTPLYHAASAGAVEVVRLLLADGRTNPAIRNRAGLSARDMAASLGFTAIADLIGQSAGGTDELSPGDSVMQMSSHSPSGSSTRADGHRL